VLNLTNHLIIGQITIFHLLHCCVYTWAFLGPGRVSGQTQKSPNLNSQARARPGPTIGLTNWARAQPSPTSPARSRLKACFLQDRARPGPALRLGSGIRPKPGPACKLDPARPGIFGPGCPCPAVTVSLKFSHMIMLQ
jgi:hypothetical protein